jgi:Spy/CpxP family protein refolding chaperone
MNTRTLSTLLLAGLATVGAATLATAAPAGSRRPSASSRASVAPSNPRLERRDERLGEG